MENDFVTAVDATKKTETTPVTGSVEFKHPRTGEVWISGKKGRKPLWVIAMEGGKVGDEIPDVKPKVKSKNSKTPENGKIYTNDDGKIYKGGTRGPIPKWVLAQL